MKTLTVALADLEGTPHGTASSRTSVRVTARYSGPVVLESGKIIPPAIKGRPLPTTGVVEFEVYESDSTLVRADHRGFAVVVTATLTQTGGPERGQGGVQVTRTVKVLNSTASPVSLGTLSPAEPVPPQWTTVADFADELTATAEAARNDAATALTAAQSSQAAAQQSAADTEVAKQAAINAAALVGAPPSEVVSAVVGRMLVDATAHGVPNDGVGGAGSPLNTLISQVSAAGGGTIILPPGVYVASGGITGAAGVTVRGASRDGTIIRKSGGTNSSWITTGDNVTAFRIENLTIDGDNKVSSRGITFAAGSKDCALSGVTIKNFGGGGVAVDTLAGASGITIENCLIASVNLAVRLNQGPNQVRIMRCTIRDWQDAAVSIVGDATYSCTDVLVEGNTVHRHAVGTPSTKARQPIRAQGVDTLHHRNVIVRGNTVTSAYTNHQDTLDPGGADLISLHRCTGFEVSGNTVRGGGDVGITIAQGCRDGRVFGNLAEDCDTPGINLGSASSVERVNRVAVFGNTLRNNGRDRADTGGTSIARAVARAKTNLVVTRAENCVVDGNVLVFDAGHATTPRYGVTWRDSVNCHIGAIGAGNKCVGHTAPYYTEAPASTGMTTTTSTPLTA